jgi:toxin ParE1/3/4
MARLLKTPTAVKDLVEIGSYIAADNPAAADRLLDKIDETLGLLAEFPGLGRAREELGRNLRCLPIGKYLLFYITIDDGIELIRVIHGARDLGRIFRPPRS